LGWRLLLGDRDFSVLGLGCHKREGSRGKEERDGKGEEERKEDEPE
jgi:hypothetical protein